ncbi:unnamed protein product [Caenorhabditis auriculariae]|uniref:Galectin n=1 Tax=Caenorhabditis auriculariae TaxID=2777116 RepID=A0A8S1H8A6_9PELO|nr:unnamed protein product [Caenorhabditis auriculariae]
MDTEPLEEEIITEHDFDSQVASTSNVVAEQEKPQISMELSGSKCFKTPSGIQKMTTVTRCRGSEQSSSSSFEEPGPSTSGTGNNDRLSQDWVPQPLTRMTFQIGKKILKFKVINAYEAPEAPEKEVPLVKPLAQPKALAGLYRCTVCKTYFGNKSVWESHMKQFHPDPRPFRCIHCGMKFLHKGTLSIHLRDHVATTQYSCKVCHKVFTRLDARDNHMRIHEIRHTCPHCGRFFRMESVLEQHQETCLARKTPSRAARFNCSYCSRTFHMNRDKVIHERVHTGERPYSCGYCGKKFAQSQSLTIHIRIHTGETPYPCNSCERNFRDNSSLRKHELAHMRPPLRQEVFFDGPELPGNQRQINEEVVDQDQDVKPQPKPMIALMTPIQNAMTSESNSSTVELRRLQQILKAPLLDGNGQPCKTPVSSTTLTFLDNKFGWPTAREYLSEAIIAYSRVTGERVPTDALEDLGRADSVLVSPGVTIKQYYEETYKFYLSEGEKTVAMENGSERRSFEFSRLRQILEMPPMIRGKPFGCPISSTSLTFLYNQFGWKKAHKYMGKAHLLYSRATGELLPKFALETLGTATSILVTPNETFKEFFARNHDIEKFDASLTFPHPIRNAVPRLETVCFSALSRIYMLSSCFSSLASFEVSQRRFLAMHSYHNPSVPGAVAVYEPLQDGCTISVHGHVRHGHHKNFAVELLSGPHIVLHVNFRFHHEHIVAMNSFSHGAWGPEIRHKNPLHHSDHFDLRITVRHFGYHITVNGYHLADFPHRFPYQSVQAVGLKGDVHVDKIHFEGFHFRTNWNSQHDFGHGGYNAYGTDRYVAPVFTNTHQYNAYWQ